MTFYVLTIGYIVHGNQGTHDKHIQKVTELSGSLKGNANNNAKDREKKKGINGGKERERKKRKKERERGK